MNTSKNIALAALSLAVVALGYIAWQQQQQLKSVRTALDAANAERQQLARRVASSEQRAVKPTGTSAVTADAKAGPRDGAGRPDDMMAPGRMRGMMASAAEMMNRPEVQKAMAIRQKAELDLNFATLFRQLQLPPEKLDQLKRLMVERQQVASDIFAAAAQQGMDPMQNRRELAKLTAEGQAKVDGEIRALLGDGDYGRYQNYQTTLPQRELVNQLQRSLSYTPNALSEAQSEQLVQILADNQPARPPGSMRENVAIQVIGGGPGGPGGAAFVNAAVGMRGATITDTAVAASRNVLSESQVQALQQMQQDQAQLRAAMPGPGHGGAVMQVRTLPAEPPPPASPQPNP